MTWGIRIVERMAGVIRFSQASRGHLDALRECSGEALDSEYPFEFIISAFTSKLFQLPFVLKFQGTGRVLGAPVSAHAPIEQREFPIHGTMAISPRGVAYHIICTQGPWAGWEMKAEKTYAWGTWSWAKFRESLIRLQGSWVSTQSSQELLANTDTIFPLALPKFLLGVSICSERFAHRPMGMLAERLAEQLPLFFPDHQKLGATDEIIQRLEDHLPAIPLIVRMLLRFTDNLTRLISILVLGKRIQRLSLLEKEKIIVYIQGSRWLKLIILPMVITLFGPAFASKEYLSKKGQPAPILPKFNEILPGDKQVQGPLRPPLERKQSIEADVVIIGTGAGGAVFAAEMAAMGKTVAIIEQGPYLRRRDLTGVQTEMFRKAYRDAGNQFCLSNAPLWIPTGRVVGGTTFINSGTCFRTPLSSREKWKHEISPEIQLEPHFEAIEEMLGGVPEVPRNLHGGIYEMMERGLRGTTKTLAPLRRAESGCDGQGLCILGCPTDAKRSTAVSFLPEALRLGAFLWTERRCDHLIYEGTRVVGVKTSVPGFEGDFDLEIRAPMVVMAAGAFGTPELLARTFGSHRWKQLGKNLSIHPAVTVGAVFPEKVRQRNYVPQSLGVMGLSGSDYVLEGYSLSIESIPSSFGLWGKELAGVMEKSDFFGNFSAMIRDTDLGHLRFTKWGVVPTYWVTDALMSRALQGVEELVEVFLRAGAERVVLPIQGAEVIKNSLEFNRVVTGRVDPARLLLSAHHPLGSCSMAKDERSGVCDAWGKVFGLDGLLIADGSMIPGPLGVNPQVTIMANSRRLAKYWEHRIC